MFKNKSLLITGGNGSFGNGFTKFLFKNYKPKRIAIFSRDELKQFEMQQRLNQSCMRDLIGDVRDRERLTMEMNGVDYVIHPALYNKVIPK